MLSIVRGIRPQLIQVHVYVASSDARVNPHPEGRVGLGELTRKYHEFWAGKSNYNLKKH